MCGVADLASGPGTFPYSYFSSTGGEQAGFSVAVGVVVHKVRPPPVHPGAEGRNNPPSCRSSVEGGPTQDSVVQADQLVEECNGWARGRLVGDRLTKAISVPGHTGLVPGEDSGGAPNPQMLGTSLAATAEGAG